MYGLTFGFSQSVVYFSYAACYYVGAILVDSGKLEYENMFTYVLCLQSGFVHISAYGIMFTLLSMYRLL
jgi:hypothetical protein